MLLLRLRPEQQQQQDGSATPDSIYPGGREQRCGHTRTHARTCTHRRRELAIALAPPQVTGREIHCLERTWKEDEEEEGRSNISTLSLSLAFVPRLQTDCSAGREVRPSIRKAATHTLTATTRRKKERVIAQLLPPLPRKGQRSTYTDRGQHTLTHAGRHSTEKPARTHTVKVEGNIESRSTLQQCAPYPSSPICPPFPCAFPLVSKTAADAKGRGERATNEKKKK